MIQYELKIALERWENLRKLGALPLILGWMPFSIKALLIIFAAAVFSVGVTFLLIYMFPEIFWLS